MKEHESVSDAGLNHSRNKDHEVEGKKDVTEPSVSPDSSFLKRIDEEGYLDRHMDSGSGSGNFLQQKSSGPSNLLRNDRRFSVFSMAESIQ